MVTHLQIAARALSADYKARLDALLQRWALDNPDKLRKIGQWTDYSWLAPPQPPEPPGAYLVPLYRMKALPKPFVAAP